nr:hypothetical protein [Orientia tsutsugamushi]
MSHILCIKLVRNFQQVSNFEKEKTVTQTEKNFPPYQKNSGPYDRYNNRSRSTEDKLVENDQKKRRSTATTEFEFL